MKRPKADEVVKALFSEFCEHCESKEDGCVNLETMYCPVFLAAERLSPDDRFVLRIMGKYMLCDKCGAMGMAPPDTTFNTPKQPVLVCQSCHGALWRGRGGILVDRPEDIHRSFAVKFVKEDGVLTAREVIDDEWLESLWEGDNHAEGNTQDSK